MAKTKHLSLLVTVNTVGWLPELNYGRHKNLVDNEQRRCEHAVMMSSTLRWDANQTIEVQEASAEFVAKFKTYVEATLTQMESQTETSKYPKTSSTPELTLNMAQRREAFKAMWYPDGKFQAPKYDATFAYQRGGSLPDAIALIIADGVKAKDAIEGYLLPIRVVEYANLAERIIACGRENTGKDTGRVSIMKHWPSLFQLAYDLFTAKAGNISQSEVNQLLAGGVVKNNNDGIKVHSLLVLNQRFPELGIADKIMNSGVNADGKDLGQEFAASLDRTRVWKMAQYLDDKKVASDATEGVDYAVATTASVVSEYLANPNAGNGEKVSMASKALVNTNMNTTPNMIEKYILRAIAINKLEDLAKIRHPALSVEALTSLNEWATKAGIAKKNSKGEFELV